ncbi:serine carboxypeptidase-like 7 isoform X1 [Gastrolobium bilobum]|uniref:serine carboxypeptidase-like 7 isoform X1 n=1 Tax=Gastrolobium bilobum TaxID=150636 RepID=UPI002AAF70C7|nr:serine carboxypeptidase-like 7 isoform X1 [Gastrolobium bilobum]
MSYVTKCFMWLSLLISTMTILSKPAVSSNIIRSLPGFSGSLPFKLETGYIGVGEDEVVQLFYYFIESEGNPTEDPLVLWMSGGPGCSSLCGLWFEIGPLKFNMVEYNGSLPTSSLNPHSWTKVSSIIFIDAPVGAGFSYSRTLEGANFTDKIHAQHCHNFMRKWLAGHPKFIANPVYIAGDSYSGMPVPIVVKYISDGNEAGDKPKINIKGYVLGNPATDRKFDWNSRIPFAHRTALISDKLYKSARMTCKGEYVIVKKDNLPCQKNLEAISERTGDINMEHVLEPKCPADEKIPENRMDDRRILQEKYRDLLLSPEQILQFGCRNYENLLLHVWANDVHVQKALHVRMGTVNAWIRCNPGIIYTKDVQSSIAYHRYLRTKYFRALIYSGDHDMTIPYLGTLWWLNSMNSTILDDWRPWIVGDLVAGYIREYSNYITFATVKASGAGHTAPEYMPKECFEMFKRWISHEPL